MKKTVLTVLAVMMMVSPIGSAGAKVKYTKAKAKYNYNVIVKVNDKAIQSDVKPFIDLASSRTYVPPRFVSETLGEKVEWDNETQTAIVKTTAGKKIKMSKGQKTVSVNGVKQTIDAPVMEVNHRLLVPLRFVSEQMGATVTYKQENGWMRIDITYEQPILTILPEENENVAHNRQPETASQSENKPPMQPEKKDRTFSPFELEAGYSTLAQHVFKNNIRIENGELVFTVPDLKRGGATHYGIRPEMNKGIHYKKTRLKNGQEYRYKLGKEEFIGFFFQHEDSNIEGYYVYLSTDHRQLKGQFSDVVGDVIVENQLIGKETASTLTEVLQMFRK